MPTNDTLIEASVTADGVRACVELLFCGADADKPLEFRRRKEPEVMPGARLYRYHMEDENGNPVTLTIYANPDELGQLFWGQEMRAMIRLGGMGHPALLNVIDGGVRDLETPIGGVKRIAYVITTWGSGDISDPQLRQDLREDPRTFFFRLVLLADALVALHRDGLLHRNISPRSISFEDFDSGTLALRLGRFEMSSLLANALRLDLENSEMVGSAALREFIAQGRSTLACIAPERLGYLFQNGNIDDVPERNNGDVFSLGVVAFQCMVGELDSDLLSIAFPAGVDPNGFKYTFDGVAWLRLHDWMRKQIAEAKIGATLRDILQRMLERNHDKRPGSLELLKMLTQGDQKILEELHPSENAPTRLVAIEPTQSTPLWEWGWLSGEPLTTREGSDELFKFLRDDLTDALMEYAPDELMRYVHRSDRQNEMPLAKYVLRGSRGYYYGHLYESRNRRNSNNPSILGHVFMVRWVLRREVVERDISGQSEPRIGQRVAPLRIVSHRAEIVTERDPAEYPSWQPLLDSITVARVRSADQEDFVKALRWLVRHQRAEIEARRYPYVRVDVGAETGGPTGRVLLRYDRERDERWLSKDAVRNLYALNKDRRPEFGTFFNPARDRGFEGKLRCWPDSDGSPKRDDHAFAVIGEIDAKSIEPDCFAMELEDQDKPVPLKGWVEPADDEGQVAASERQADASLNFLMQRPTLVAKLLAPAAFLRSGDAWVAAADGLIGTRTTAAIRRSLAADPIYVLQGPPGTGKSTVISRAVIAAIKSDPGIRILIAAQSHYALDNLALAILDKMPKSSLAVRLVSDSTDKRVDSRVKQWTRENLLASRPIAVKERVLRHRDAQGLEPAEREIVQKWYDAIDQSHLEIVDRTFDGANFVFATCSHASAAGSVVPGRPDQYDWVIVEEAAKALPSELAIPLVRGPRWMLVGDHLQLSPYRLKEIEAFLIECVQALRQDKGLAVLLDGAENFPQFFNLFERIFKRGARTDPEKKVHGYDRQPIDALDTQFRMVPPIGDMVGHAFYKDELCSGRLLEPIDTLSVAPFIPKWFGDKRLVWLNTDDESLIFGNGQYADGEIAIIARLLDDMWKSRAPNPRDLAILTPYRRQRAELIKGLDQRFAQLVHTTDSFQGREAEVVIVSLVRGYLTKPPTTIYSRIGHLAERQRVNVMLSRAREFLVLVGQFKHFHDAGRSVLPGEDGSFWTPVCEHFRDKGLIRSTTEFGQYNSKRS